MSTRANIVIKDERQEFWFYRHSDGYPEGTMPTLEKFLSWVKGGRIRDNAAQAAGWLIIIGHVLYKVPDEPALPETEHDKRSAEMGYGAKNWKVGAYEPAGGKHGDIDYLYTVDLTAKTIECRQIEGYGESAKIGEVVATA